MHAVSAVIRKAADTIDILYVSDSRKDVRLEEVCKLARGNGVKTQLLTRHEMDKRFQGVRHQGLVASCQAAEPLSEPQMLQKLIDLDHAALVMVLDGVTDPHNLGAILRTADAAGVDCVIAPRNASVGITPVVRKVASGAAETVAFCQVANLARSLAELKAQGIWTYGAAIAKESVSYTTVDYSGPVALVFGAEGGGLRRLTRESCDGLIHIPMAGSVESLNVSVACGICLYEVARQRTTSS